MRIGLAKVFNQDARQSVARQKQTDRGSGSFQEAKHMRRSTDCCEENNALKRGLIKLARVTWNAYRVRWKDHRPGPVPGAAI